MNSDSGVVTRMWGGFFVIFCRSAGGVSPVRTAARTAGIPIPSSAPSARISARGPDRFFSTSFERALSGET